MTIDATALSIGGTVALATVAALWKVGPLRSEVFGTYQRRVDLAQAGLDERAARALRSLAEAVNTTLGVLEAFDPDQALADPSTLRAQIDRVRELLGARIAVRRCFDRMLRVGPLLLGVLSTALVGTLLGLAYFSGWRRTRAVGYGGLWTATVMGVIAVGIVAYYFLLLHQFSGVEILSASDDD
jgi:hypothetical protein